MTYRSDQKQTMQPGWQRQPMGYLIDPAARCYMHLSGTTTTADRNYAWFGTRDQARALKKAYPGEWTFKFGYARSKKTKIRTEAA